MTTAIILVSGLLFFLRVWLRRRTLTQLTWTGEGPPPALSKTEMQVVKMITMPLVINVVTVGNIWATVATLPIQQRPFHSRFLDRGHELRFANSSESSGSDDSGYPWQLLFQLEYDFLCDFQQTVSAGLRQHHL